MATETRHARRAPNFSSSSHATAPMLTPSYYNFFSGSSDRSPVDTSAAVLTCECLQDHAQRIRKQARYILTLGLGYGCNVAAKKLYGITEGIMSARGALLTSHSSYPCRRPPRTGSERCYAAACPLIHTMLQAMDIAMDKGRSLEFSRTRLECPCSTTDFLRDLKLLTSPAIHFSSHL